METSDVPIDWASLESLANDLEKPGVNPAGVAAVEWRKIERAVRVALEYGDLRSLIRLRLLFGFLLARDTVTGDDTIRKLENASIEAAESLGDKSHLADFLGARGHNLHRRGYHQESIDSFHRAAALYQDLGESFAALKSYYMTSLCLRALGKRDQAIEVLADVLSRTGPDNTWRGNPLQVKAWLLQDVGKLAEAEQSLRQALDLHEEIEGGQILVAGTLADLGEVVGLQGRGEEARHHFARSLSILKQFEGQYQRQEARTRLKLAELCIRERNYDQACRLLNEADDAIRSSGGYYDLLWRIELARSYALFRTGKVVDAVKKVKVVLSLRRELSLSNSLLVQQLVSRFWKRSGLPR